MQAGETLSHIALHYYGNATRWPEIHEANRAIIGSDPNLIRAGQFLCIPGAVRVNVPGKTSAVPMDVERVAIAAGTNLETRTLRLKLVGLADDVDFGPLTATYANSTTMAMSPEEIQRAQAFLQPIWNVAMGDPQSASEMGGDIVLSLFVIGDIRDVAKQGYLFATRDPNANGWVFVFAVAGVVSTGNAPVDGGLAALKVAAKILPAIKGGSKIVGDAIEQAMLQGFTSLNLERLLKLPGIARLAEKISSRNAYQAYERVLHNRASVENLAKYVDETGDVGLTLIERAGAQIGRTPAGFSSWTQWMSHFKDHGAATGLAWEGQQFKTAQDYLGVAISIIKNPSSKKVLYYHQSNLNDPTLGYLLERNGKVFLVAVSKEGNIKSFHHLDQGWGYVQEGFVWNKLFKVDPF